ncbi:MAG: sigma-70 family RNA polymerase sigma factor [Nitrospinae bacterium]|nr:sigma-70 family RNA polymerase sigma factor [Nitrospinota bacterium]
MDETQTIEKAREGDTEAFRILFDKHKGFVWNVAVRMSGDTDEAEDIAQDVFVSAWKNLPAFRGGSSFSTWIYRITVNRVLNGARKKNLAMELKDEAARIAGPEIFIKDNPAAQTEKDDAEKTLMTILSRLSPERRIAVILREIEGLSYEEIAEATGAPVGTVRSRIARGRNDLAQIAGEMERENEGH